MSSTSPRPSAAMKDGQPPPGSVPDSRNSSWNPEDYAYRMLAGQNTLEEGDSEWRSYVFKDAEDMIVEGKEWPRPLFFRFLPIFWNHQSHRLHLLLDLALCVYFLVVMHKKPQWFTLCADRAGLPSGVLDFVCGGISVRFALMALQLTTTRRFAIHGHTKEMLLEIVGGDDCDGSVVPLEEQFFTSVMTALVTYSFAALAVCYALFDWAHLAEIYVCFVLPLTYLNFQERLCSMAICLAASYSKCLVDDFCRQLKGTTKASRNLGLWDLFTGSTPADVRILHNPAPIAGENLVQEGFWISMIREHQQLNRDLVYVWFRAEIPFILFLLQAALFIFGATVMAFVSSNFLFQAACAVVAGSHALMSFGLDLLPCAQVTDMCMSTCVGLLSIRSLSNRHFARENMSPQVQMEHGNYMYYINGTPSGINLPVFGSVSMAGIFSTVKLIGAVLPIAVAHFAIVNTSRSWAEQAQVVAMNATGG